MKKLTAEKLDDGKALNGIGQERMFRSRFHTEVAREIGRSVTGTTAVVSQDSLTYGVEREPVDLCRPMLISVNRELVQRYFPKFRFHHHDDAPYFDGWVTVSTGRKYQLRLILNIPSADELPRPELYVWSPVHLRSPFGGTILEISHAFHTGMNGTGGRVQIDYGIPPQEEIASHTYVAILHRGMLWLEAYEKGLASGRSIEDWLG